MLVLLEKYTTRNLAILEKIIGKNPYILCTILYVGFLIQKGWNGKIK